MQYEKELIGSALQDSSILDPERIPDSLFTDGRNRAIWRAMLALRGAGAPVNLLTIAESLNGDAAEVGASYLAGCSDTGSAAAAPFYIGKLTEAARLRAIRILLMESTDALEKGKDSDDLVTALEAGLLRVRSRADVTATVRPEEALREILKVAEERIRTGATGPTGVPSGFPILDSMTGGFQPGDLVLVGARTTVGKSALAMSFMERQIDRGWKVALASLEMSAVQVWQRLLSMRSFVSTGKLRFGHLNGEDYRALVTAASELRKCGLPIIDRPNLTVGSLRSWAAGMVAEGCSILYVDYVGLLRGSDNGAPRWEQMLEVSRCLKAIARELNIPVIALVQLNREAADMREPGLHNIRDTGALEQDADVVLILTRSEAESAEDSIPASLFLKKQRSGPTGKIALMFRKSLTQFREAGE